MLYDADVDINFNPRSPHGERHNQRRAARGREYISIHAPRTGSDHPVLFLAGERADFNPRSPHGERHFSMSHINEDGTFQSTLPARGATLRMRRRTSNLSISIHAPRTGSDTITISHTAERGKFQSTLPARGATIDLMDKRYKSAFQSTLPARGATGVSVYPGQ